MNGLRWRWCGWMAVVTIVLICGGCGHSDDAAVEPLTKRSASEPVSGVAETTDGGSTATPPHVHVEPLADAKTVLALSRSHLRGEDDVEVHAYKATGGPLRISIRIFWDWLLWNSNDEPVRTYLAAYDVYPIVPVLDSHLFDDKRREAFAASVPPTFAQSETYCTVSVRKFSRSRIPFFLHFDQAFDHAYGEFRSGTSSKYWWPSQLAGDQGDMKLLPAHTFPQIRDGGESVSDHVRVFSGGTSSIRSSHAESLPPGESMLLLLQYPVKWGSGDMPICVSVQATHLPLEQKVDADTLREQVARLREITKEQGAANDRYLLAVAIQLLADAGAADQADRMALFDESVQHLRQAVTAAPANQVYRLLLNTHRYRLGWLLASTDQDRAVRIMRELLSEHPSYDDALNAARILMHCHNEVPDLDLPDGEGAALRKSHQLEMVRILRRALLRTENPDLLAFRLRELPILLEWERWHLLHKSACADLLVEFELDASKLSRYLAEWTSQLAAAPQDARLHNLLAAAHGTLARVKAQPSDGPTQAEHLEKAVDHARLAVANAADELGYLDRLKYHLQQLARSLQGKEAERTHALCEELLKQDASFEDYMEVVSIISSAGSDREWGGEGPLTDEQRQARYRDSVYGYVSAGLDKLAQQRGADAKRVQIQRLDYILPYFTTKWPEFEAFKASLRHD